MDDNKKKDSPKSREDRNYFMEIGTEFAVDEDNLVRREEDKPLLQDRLLWGLGIGFMGGLIIGLLIGLYYLGLTT